MWAGGGVTKGFEGKDEQSKLDVDFERAARGGHDMVSL